MNLPSDQAFTSAVTRGRPTLPLPRGRRWLGFSGLRNGGETAARTPTTFASNATILTAGSIAIAAVVPSGSAWNRVSRQSFRLVCKGSAKPQGTLYISGPWDTSTRLSINLSNQNL